MSRATHDTIVNLNNWPNEGLSQLYKILLLIKISPVENLPESGYLWTPWRSIVPPKQSKPIDFEEFQKNGCFSQRREIFR